MTLFYKYHLRSVLEIQADLGQEPADPALGGNGAPKQVCDTPFVARLCNNLDLLEDILVGLDFGVSKDSYLSPHVSLLSFWPSTCHQRHDFGELLGRQNRISFASDGSTKLHPWSRRPS